jgi:serine O-acetyltransferase
MMTLSQVLQADLYRIDGQQGNKRLLLAFVGSPSFRYTVLFRLCQHSKRYRSLKFSVYPWLLVWFSRLGRKLGIRLPLSCQVGPGLLIEHWGGIWINPAVSIGANCNLSHNVTLGWAGQEGQKGAPQLGDNVFLGPGAVVLGKIKVGSGALITANSVVLQDVPENGVLMGNPGRVFSQQGSRGMQKHLFSPAEASHSGKEPG